MKEESIGLLKIDENTIVATLALGSWPKERLAKVRVKSEARESHFMLLGVWESVREWTPTFPNGVPFWELESRIFKGGF
jgi:hypothetical protein